MKVVANLSFPSSQRVEDRMEHLPKRRCVVTVRYSDSSREDSFAFSDVFAMTVTYHHACSEEMITAYDQLVEVESSPWLREIQKRVARAGESTDQLRHYRIYFDDGPCYEFISRGHGYSTRNA